MEGDCEECSKWEQIIYWNHFRSIHFCRILPSDFRSQLMIPQKFSDFAKGKIQEKITLKGPSGTTTWEVGLIRNGDKLFLKDGWTEFVNAYSLEENDILIFKYDGNSSFSVLIFDQGSLCEKETSYFIKKCGHSKPSSDGNQHKGFLKETIKEFTQEYSQKDLELNLSREMSVDADGQNPISPEHRRTCDIHEISQQPIPDVHKTSQMKTPSIDVENGEDIPKKQNSWSFEAVQLSPVIEKQHQLASINMASCGSKGRLVSEEQKEAALRMARKHITEDSFLTVMRPTHVNRVFYLNVPVSWMNQHITFKNQTVQLRRNARTCATKFSCRPDGRAGLRHGWREFALDNQLKEFDVCVFKLASQRHEPVILDVRITRVVADAVKPAQSPPASTGEVPYLCTEKVTDVQGGNSS